MVIYIDKTISVHGKETALTDEEELFFGQLAVANQRGYCMLCGDIDSLEWLAENLGGQYGKSYAKILSKYHRIAVVLNAVEAVMVVTYDDQPQIPKILVGKGIVLKVPSLLEMKIDQQCSLVCENLRDCQFYELVAQRYIADHGLKGMGISFRKEQGDGGSIHTVFQKVVETDRVLALCVVDSDVKYRPTKKHPEDPPVGSTLTTLRSTYNELKNKDILPTFELMVIPTHEVENIIPFAVLEKLSSTSIPNMQNGVVFLRKLMASNCRDALLCYDLKNGRKKIKQGPSETFWNEVYTIIGDCSHPAVCEKLLDKALPILQDFSPENNESAIRVNLDAYLQDVWETVGHKVFTWGCASQAARS